MRYIDAEALTDHMLERYDELCEKHGDYDHYTTGYGDAIDAIENAPTADVVPKSEVDLYRKQVDELEDELASTYDKLETAKAKVAREIFEEIDKNFIIITLYISNITFAELKKKYTEGEK